MAGCPGSQTGLVARDAGQADWHGKQSPSISVSGFSILGSPDDPATWIPTSSSAGALGGKLEVEGKGSGEQDSVREKMSANGLGPPHSSMNK